MQIDAAVEGLVPALDLVQFISRFLPLRKEGNQHEGCCAFHDDDAHSLKISGNAWRCVACGSHEIAGTDAVAFYACWTSTSREEAAAALGNGAGLPDAKPITQVPLKRLPFWGGWALDKPQLRDKAVWIHDLSGSVLIWRELMPERVHLGIIQGQSWDKPGMLGQLAKRKCVLVPENNPASRVTMQRLAAALYRAGHEKVMRLDIGIDERFGTRELPGAGDDVLKWAKVRSVAYPHPDMVNAAPQAGQDQTPTPSQEGRAAGLAVAAPNAAPELGPEHPSVAPATLEPAQEAAPQAPQRAQTHAKGNGGAGAPLTPAERVQAQERAARAEVLAGLVYTCIADVRPEAVKWLWPGRIPLGELTMIVGDPGLGKSQICASLASVVTNGGQWPVDRAYAEQGSVLILSAEDNIKHTIRPRLDAANADVSRCHTLQAVKRISEQGMSFEGGFNLAEDLAKLSVLMDEIGDVRLVVIDPVSAYLGETDSHKNAEVRGMLAPLTTLAGNHSAAIILVSHLTKSQSANALMRVQGSIAFAALCRAVWGVTADKEDRQRRLFMPLKNNLGQDKTGLGYCIESYTLEGAEEHIPTSRVSWESTLVETSVDEAFGASLTHDERTELDEAKEFLREALADGRIKAQDVQRMAKSAGHSLTTLGRAKRDLRIQFKRVGFGAGSQVYWWLKDDAAPPEYPPE